MSDSIYFYVYNPKFNTEYYNRIFLFNVIVTLLTMIFEV